MAAVVGAARGGARGGRGCTGTMGQPCVLVVDYAETRRDLVGLLDDVAADRDGPDLRVVLLARSAGEWWQQLLASAEEQTAALLEAHAPVMLGPVRAAGGPQEVFDDALSAFARKLGTCHGRMPGWSCRIRTRWCWWCMRRRLLAVVDYATGARPAGSGRIGSVRCWRRCCGMRPGTGRGRRLAGAWTWM